MMRDGLQPYLGQRLTVQAQVLRFSRSRARGGAVEPTVLLGTVVTLTGVTLADHVWLTVGQRLAVLDLHLGDVVQFSGRVAPYRRYSIGDANERVWGSTDCRLVLPTRCGVVARAPREVAEPHPPEHAPTNSSRLLATIGLLWSERGDPPSLARVIDRAGMNPLTVVHHLMREAKASRVAFRPDGRVYLTSERNH